jgi:putative ABC transport system ATP-binding protein
VVITSSPVLLAQTDRVLLLDEGTVTVSGDHAGLGASDATYQGVVLR